MKTKLPKQNIKKLAKLHVIFTLALFVLYVGLSIVYSPDFLLSDIRSKYSAIADSTITILAKVLGPPVVPIVLGTTNCINGVITNTISWPADENSQSFEIQRDGVTLMTGLINSNYNDSVIDLNLNTSYDYTVTAFGSMGPGFAVSVPFSITTPTECQIILPPMEITNTSLLKVPGALDYDHPNETSTNRPTFFGSVNTPNAIINLEIHSSIIIVGQTTANAAGYWTWTSPSDVSEGPHTLFVTAQDPNDTARTSSASLAFEIESDDIHDGQTTSDNNDKKKNNDNKPRKIPTQPAPIKKLPITEQQPTEQKTQATKIPLDFSIMTSDEKIFQGKDFVVFVKIEKIDPAYENYNASIKYNLIDKNNNVLLSSTDKKTISDGAVIAKNIELAKNITDGTFQLQVEILLDKYSISKQMTIKIEQLPMINLGGGFVITYPYLLSKIGTIAIWLLLLLLIWIFLFSREYWLYLHALRHITEKNLEKLGLISLKKNN
ncbi:MAG: Ig-like domain-containing protein [bacterium]